MTKNAYSFFKYLNFCLDFFVHVGKRLYKKAKVNFRIYDVITGKQYLQYTLYTISQEVMTIRQ